MIMLSESLLSSSIKRGAILHSYMFRNIDHGKFFVVVGISEDKVAGFFFINSNINKFNERSQTLMNAQLFIRKENYDFLTHDSFICATRFTEIKVSQIVKSIQEGQTTFVSDLLENDLKELINSVRSSRLFTTAQKNKYAKV